MTRSWSLVATLSLGGSYAPGGSGFIATDANNTVMYLFASNGQKVWSWDGTTLTDISGTTFTGASVKIVDITFFNDVLYVAYNAAAADDARVAKWNGGQSWSDVWLCEDESANRGDFITTLTYSAYLDSDDSRIAAVFGVSATGRTIIGASTDGSSWAAQTVDGSYANSVVYKMYGNAKNTGYTELLTQRNTGTFRPPTIAHSSGINWAALGGDVSGAPSVSFIGYADGYSFYRGTIAATSQIVKSTDWGENISTAGGISDPAGNHPRCSVRTIVPTAVMLCTREDDQAYTWDFDNDEFITDGTVTNSAHHILAYFRLGSTLYALCKSDSSGEAKVYGGGTVVVPGSLARFYHGLGILTEKFTLPFTDVNPGAMTLDKSLGTVVAGANQPSGVMAVYSQHPYPTGTATADGLPTGTAITSLKWI